MPRLPRHSTVAAYLALFVAVGTGGAYAANEFTGDNIVDESLMSVDIKNQEVKYDDLAFNSVSSSRVVNNTLTGEDVDESKLGKVPAADKLDDLDSADLKVRCAADTTFHAGACIEKAARSAATHEAAKDTCEALKRRLPSEDELRTFRYVPGVDFATWEWSSFIYRFVNSNDNWQEWATAVNELSDGPIPAHFSQPFRCAAAPTA